MCCLEFVLEIAQRLHAHTDLGPGKGWEQGVCSLFPAQNAKGPGLISSAQIGFHPAGSMRVAQHLPRVSDAQAPGQQNPVHRYFVSLSCRAAIMASSAVGVPIPANTSMILA